MRRLSVGDEWQDLGHVCIPLGGCQEKISKTDEVDEGVPFTCPLTMLAGVAVDGSEWYPLRAVVCARIATHLIGVGAGRKW